MKSYFGFIMLLLLFFVSDYRFSYCFLVFLAHLFLPILEIKLSFTLERLPCHSFQNRLKLFLSTLLPLLEIVFLFFLSFLFWRHWLVLLPPLLLKGIASYNFFQLKDKDVGRLSLKQTKRNINTEIFVWFFFLCRSLLHKVCTLGNGKFSNISFFSKAVFISTVESRRQLSVPMANCKTKTAFTAAFNAFFKLKVQLKKLKIGKVLLLQP